MAPVAGGTKVSFEPQAVLASVIGVKVVLAHRWNDIEKTDGEFFDG